MGVKSRFLKGQLLLDSGQLQGSFFQRTVVLICQHDHEGAFGLILNRPAGKTASEVFLSDLPESLQEEALYVGGPVQPAALTFLKSDLVLPSTNVMASLTVGHSIEDLLEAVSPPSLERRLRMFAGYAGWSAGQLEEEMKREAWLTHPASFEAIFETEADKLWSAILTKKGGVYKMLAQSPEDLSWN